MVEQIQAGIQIDIPEAFRIVNEANLRAIENYQAKPLLGSASLYQAMDQGLAGKYDSLGNWRYLVPKGLRVHTIPGNHLTILEEPNVRELAAKLVEDIALAEQRIQAARADQAPYLLRAG